MPIVDFPDLFLNGDYSAHVIALYAILAAHGGSAESMHELHGWSKMSYRTVLRSIQRLERDGHIRLEPVKLWHGHSRHSIHLTKPESKPCG